MKAQEAFAALVKQQPGWLDRPIEDLVKLRAVGDVYLAAHKRMMKEIKAGKVGLAEEDLRTRQSEADTVGCAVLDAKVKIGQMSKEQPRTLSGPPVKGTTKGGGTTPSGNPLKHARLGLGANEMQRFQTLARHPDVIEKVKAEAREYGDPPTETAVLKEIQSQNWKAKAGKPAKEEKPDINEVASEVFQKLSFASGKLRAIWPHRDSISDFYLKGIRGSIAELIETTGGAK